MKKFLAVLVGMLLLTGSFAGCGKVTQQIDTSKTQIYANTFNGGMGTDWLLKVAADFNASSEEYQVLVADPNKDQYEIISSQIKTGVAVNDIFFNTNNLYIDLAMGDYLEPLDEVLDMKPDGPNGLTVREKLRDPDMFLTPYVYEGSTYCLPFTDLILGFICDYDLCERRHWLVTDEHGNISAGRDGKTGTYDDGLPVDMDEFDAMIDRILADPDGIPFNYSGGSVAYLNQIVQAVHAQYDGLEAFKTFYSYSGSFKNANGNTVTVTPAEGYKVYDMPGLQKSLEFLDEYFLNPAYYTEKSDKATYAFDQAQTNFIMGAAGIKGYQLSAFHIDGEWWENESRSTFNSLEGQGNEAFAFGERDYRLMPIPTQDGAYGVDGEGNGSTVAAIENGNIFVKKQTDEHKRQGIMEFLAYTCSDEALKTFSLYTGAMRPFNYTLEDDEIAGLTKLQQSVMELKQDPNIQIVRPELYKYLSTLNYMPASGPRHYDGTAKDGTYYQFPWQLMSPLYGNMTPAELVASIKKEMTDSWATMYGDYYA